MTRKIICTVAALAIAAPAAFAAADTHVLHPGDFATGKPEFSEPHGTGTNPFGWDWDSDSPIASDAVGGAPGFGSYSLYSDVDKFGADQPDRYRTFRIGFRDLTFGGSAGMVTVGDIESITYWNHSVGAGDAYWRPSIYTTHVGDGDDMASWYRNRIQALPTAAGDTWASFATDGSGDHQFSWYTNRTGFTAPNIDFAELNSGTVVRGTESWDFSVEEVMMLDISLGADSGGFTGEAYLDGITITLKDGRSATIHFIPEPATLSLLGLGGLALLRRRR